MPGRSTIDSMTRVRRREGIMRVFSFQTMLSVLYVTDSRGQRVKDVTWRKSTGYFASSRKLKLSEFLASDPHPHTLCLPVPSLVLSFVLLCFLWSAPTGDVPVRVLRRRYQGQKGSQIKLNT
ncbi:hypothetical protein BgiMline_003464 [Biomphalaria glabrata]|nr:hypothetical protein BgiMline_012013 [Biomphalaria glabrata]KAI8793446.1 hypothetical protein BgiBS90_006435 [Biomphalaria glabrata]